MHISVFGSARPQPSDKLYRDAYSLGRILGTAGHIVLTGGYCGTMEAVSRGAAENGAHVIGVTCEEVERWRAIGANNWVQEEWRTQDLVERITKMIAASSAAIALLGGIGTLTEIMLTWNHLAIHAIDPIPLILIGKEWKKVFRVFKEEQNGQINPDDLDMLTFFDSVETAESYLRELINQ